MTERQAHKLKDLFFRIKQFYYGVSDKTLSAANLTAGEATEYIGLLKEAQTDCFAPDEGRTLPVDADEMLGKLCALTLTALKEKNIRLAGDLAALGVRLLGVYTFPNMSRRRFWQTCVLPFCDRHGDAFFAEEEAAFLAGPNTAVRLRPTFRKNKEGHYYEDDSDEALSLAHPVLYYVFVVLGVILLFGSVIGFGLVSGLTLSLSSPWLVLGYFGAAAVGVGLYSLIMAFVHQYMGHIATLVLWILGGACVALSLFMAG